MTLILTCAPFRISFAGGGTDLPSFYKKEYGAVLSSTIDSYIYVMINGRKSLFKQGIRFSQSALSTMQEEHYPSDPFQYPIRVSYSSTENVHKVDELQHPIVREALRLLEIDAPMDIATIADIPAGTGLGASSTFAVACLHALHAFKGEQVTPDQLASEAAHIEINMLGRPGGKQDHYAAAFGGFNLLTFYPDGEVGVQPVGSQDLIEKRLFSCLMLFYTGVCRDSATILMNQEANTAARHGDLIVMRDHARKLGRFMSDGLNPIDFGQILHKTWMHKRTLASGITNSRIDEHYEIALRAGALGGKICGAGGGGFLLLMAKPERRKAVREALSDLPEMEFRFQSKGSQILLS